MGMEVPAKAANDNDGTKLNLWIPGLVIKMAGNIATNQIDDGHISKELFKNIGIINLCVREGDEYNNRTDKKITGKLNNMEKKSYEQL